MNIQKPNFDDSLASVMRRGAVNEQAIPLLHAPIFKFLSDIHDGMMAATEPPVDGKEVPMLLVLQGQHYFMGAVRIALGGMLSPTFPLLRAALESVAYAILAEGSRELSLVWAMRDQSDETRKVFRGKFSFSNALIRLKTLDAELADHFSYLYDMSIKHGAHPNIAGVMGGVTTSSRAAGEKNINMRIIHHAGSEEVSQALDAVAHFGAAAGAGFRYALPKHSPAAAVFDRFVTIHQEMSNMFDARTKGK